MPCEDVFELKLFIYIYILYVMSFAVSATQPTSAVLFYEREF